jgi:hypothetical protein
MENKTVFPIKDILELRQRAQQATDPMALLAAFTSLHIKNGFTLCASFTPHAFEGRVGYIWAISELGCGKYIKAGIVDLCDLPRPFPTENSCLDGLEMTGSSMLFRPVCAVDNVMEAIEGDGAPRSYLEASIFARKAAEFRAHWHGVVWSAHTVLGGDPWIRPHDWAEHDEEEPSPEQDWHWLCCKPSEWEPSVVYKGQVIIVKFYTYSRLVKETIYCYSDTYKPNSYKFEWDVEIITEGPGGYIT